MKVINSALYSKLRIVAAGKGTSMCLPPVVNAVVDLVQQKENEIRLVYLGTASYDKMEAFHRQTHAYRDIPNCTIHKLDLSEAVDRIPSSEEIQSTIDSAHVIMVSGGNTKYALDRWKALGVDRMIQQACMKPEPPVLCGGSAGAVSWFEFAHSDCLDPTSQLYVDPQLTDEQKKNWEYTKLGCLGFIPALVVPHYDTQGKNGRMRAVDSENMLLEDPELPAIGIDEAAALVFCDGKVRVVSGDAKAKCYIKVVQIDEKDDFQVRSRVFSEDHGSVPIEDVLKGKVLDLSTQPQ